MVVYTRKKTVAKRRPRTRTRTARKGGVKSMVRRMIAKTEEVKNSPFRSKTNLVPYAHAGFLPKAMTPLTLGLTVQQGVGQGQRVGNKINVKSLYFRYVLYPLGYDATENAYPKPLNVLFVLYYNKKSLTEIDANLGDFFQFGNSTEGFSDTLADLVKPFNRDKYTVVKSWIHKLGTANYEGTNGGPDLNYFANNDYKYNYIRKVNLTKHIPKLITYNDTTLEPSSKLLNMICIPFYATNTVMPVGNTVAQLEYQLDLRYTDS